MFRINEVLEQYFENVAVQYVHRLDEIRLLDARDQIETLADFWFRGEVDTRKEIGFMLECFGAAVNDDVLRVTKTKFDRHCKVFLAEIFSVVPAPIMPTAKDAAELAYVLVIGLRSAVYFDDDINLESAHSLFLGTMLRLTGLD